MELSKHFTLEELTYSSDHPDIPNVPNADQVENLKLIASTLELIRALIGEPIHVSSGFRCPALNRAVKGSVKSAHMDGLAADIYVAGMPAKTLAKRIANAKIPMDQLIYEGSWVHVGLALEVQRNQVLTASFAGGKATYTNGLPA